MPTLNNINENRVKKGFKKRDYRPWNMDGTNIEEQSPLPHLSNEQVQHDTGDQLLEVDPNTIVNWKYHDRPSNELGDIQQLAEEFKTIGQQQPCIVRMLKTPQESQHKYELIVGERRWEAAKLAKTLIKVIVKNLSDSEFAIIQASENSSRKDLSDYAKGTSYAKLIQDKVVTQQELIDKLNISPQQMSKFLSFKKIPQRIKDTFGNMSKISCSTAETIVQLSKKGEQYEDAILSLKDKLVSGEIGFKKLKLYVDKQISEVKINSNSKISVYSPNGKHLFTWRYDNNNLPSIHFPKDVLRCIDREKLNKTMQETINDLLLESKNPVDGI
jgi:ParB family chromosome partitioning protein